MIDAALIAYTVKYKGLNELLQAGVSQDDFLDEYRTVWRYLMRAKRDHDAIPSADTLLARFPDLELPRVRKSELPLLLNQLRQRSRFINFMHILQDAVTGDVTPESIDDAIQTVQGRLNSLAYSGGQVHLVDLFHPETGKLLVEEIKDRRAGRVEGIPTGLKRFDRANGGLQPQKFVVAIGRTGIGKSWLDLKFTAKAVIEGRSCILYPLEMTLFETAMRLYTIFSAELMGRDRVLKNLDLVHGKVNTRKVVRFLSHLEDRYAGSLHVADIGSLSEQYTVERIEAEVEAHRPDMFWVDYITLLKPPPGAKQDADHVSVRRLSSGLAGIAKRRNLVGGCSAQVNREALKARVFLPRLEHIAYGDSIGQDADIVFSLNRKRNDAEHLYYALVKMRGGLEFGTTRMRFAPNVGDINETAEQPTENEDEE